LNKSKRRVHYPTHTPLFYPTLVKDNAFKHRKRSSLLTSATLVSIRYGREVNPGRTICGQYCLMLPSPPLPMISLTHQRDKCVLEGEFG